MDKKYLRVSAVIFFTTAAVFSTIYTPQAILPSIRDDLNLTITEVNLLLSAMMYVLMLGTPLYAPVTQLLGRKNTMLLATAGLTVPTLIAAVAPSYSWLLLSRIFQGLFVPGVTAVMLAYIQSVFPKQNVGLALGIYMSATSLGGVMGRLLSGWITELYTWRTSFTFFTALLIIGVIFMFFWLPSEPNSNETKTEWTWSKLKPALFHFPIFAALTIPAIAFFSFMSITTFSTFYLAGSPFNLSPGQLGSTFLILFLGVFVSPIAGRWSDKVGRARIILLGLIFLIIGAALTLVANIFIVIIGLGLVTMGMFVSQAAAPAYIGELLKREKTISAILYQMFFYFGGAMGTLLPSYLWPKYEYLGVVLLTEGVIILGMITFTSHLFLRNPIRNSKV